MNNTSIVALFLLCSLSLFGQKDKRLASHLNPLTDVPQIIMPAQDNAALQAEENERRGPGIAPRYAVNLEVDIDPTTQGRWERTEDDKKVWRLRIKSPEAYSINLGFSRYNMPRGGKLLLYTPDYSQVKGPFTPSDNEEHEQLWTPIIPGDELVIEVQLPSDQLNNLELKLSYVNHAFQDFASLLSGSCNLDVICGGADGWGIVDAHRDIIQSVAVISTGGGTFCTGFLVNNVEEDCTPYFMTANHCGINSGNAPSLVTYWNFINSTCREPGSPQSGGGGDGQLNDFNTGAIFRAGRSNSDFTLVELDDPVSATANAYFAGWDASASAISSAIGVHHPNTDEKRISFENDPLQFTNGFGTNPSANFTHVRVIDWDVGTTEPGSSGSPLFDQNDRVVGQLHGGGAACGNNQSDWYGAFATSWDAGGSANSRLKDWLDPTNSGTLVVNGRYANSCSFSIVASPNIQTVCSPLSASYSLEIGEAFSSTVSLSASGLPSGASANFSPSNVSPGGTSTLNISTSGVNPGTYTITLMANGGGDFAETEITLTVLSGSSNPPSLIEPANNSTGIFPNPVLDWDGDDSGSTTYEVQIASNSNFSNIIEIGNTTATSYQPSNAGDGLTTYYWRVRGTNFCGVSPYSSVFNFTTQNIDCITYTSSSSSAISEVGTPFIQNDIFVGDDNTIADVIITLDVTHTYVGDLDATLIPPAGGVITLFDQPGEPNEDFGCSEDNLFVSFSGNSPNSSSLLENTCNTSNTGFNNPGPPYAIEGSYQPLGNINGLINQSSLGLWTLEMNDNASADGGTLEYWSVTICYSVTSTPPVIVTNNILEVPRGDQEDVTQVYLEVEDQDSSPSEIIFTLTELPIEGNLLLNGGVLQVGDTFTQADINNGLVTYAHNGGIILDDQFEFDVTNAAGESLMGNLFFIEITVDPMMVSLEQGNTINCNGDMTASLTVIVSGGLPPYQYAINGGDFQVPNIFEGLGAGDYSVEVLDDLGDIVGSPVFNIAQPTALSASTVVNEDEINVMADGGSPPYLYSINGGMATQSSPIFSDLDNGDYTVTIIDANDCITTTDATILVNTLVVSGALVSDITCHDADDAVITVLASGGTPPYTYSLDDGDFQGSNLFTFIGAGSHQVTVMDDQGFTNSTSTILVTNPSELTVSASVDLFTITANANGGTPPYLFSLEGGTNSQSSPVFNDLSNGTYTVTVIDDNDCISTTTATVSVNTLVVNATLINDISCHDANDGSIEVAVNGGATPYQYSLDGVNYQQSNIFTDLAQGTYQITVKDDEDFTRTTETIIITNPVVLNAEANANLSSIEVGVSGGTTPYLYSLDGGQTTQSSPVFNNLPNGTYTVTVIDANDCVATSMATIAVNTLVVNANLVNDISCHDFNDGSISASVSGGSIPFEYSLDGINYQMANTFNDLEAGIYQITVRDSEGFTRTTETVTIHNPALLTATASLNTTTVTVSADGGTLPYTYSLNDVVQSSPIFSDLPNGTHIIMITDANDCVTTTSVEVAVNTLIVSAVLVNDIRCYNINDGRIRVDVNGGAAPYEYSLDGELYQEDNLFSGLAPGEYQIWVRDIDGFTRLSNPIPVSNPPELMMMTEVVTNNITITASGGTGALEYSINGIDFQSENTFSNLDDGIYQATVRDASGCAITVELIIAVTSIQSSIQVTMGISCFDANDAVISANAFGGIPPYEYSLDGVNFQASPSFSNLGPATYVIWVKDAVETIISTTELLVNNPSLLTLESSINEDTILAEANGGTGDYLFSLDGVNFQESNQFAGLENGDYEIWVQDENGCQASEMVSILVGLFEVTRTNLSFELFPNPSDGQFQLILQQATGSEVECYIYNVSGQLVLQKSFENRSGQIQASFDLSSFPAGMYEVVLTDGYLLGTSRIIIQK